MDIAPSECNRRAKTSAHREMGVPGLVPPLRPKSTGPPTKNTDLDENERSDYRSRPCFVASDRTNRGGSGGEREWQNGYFSRRP